LPPGFSAFLWAYFFWFGDRALREIWHLSFFASLMIWGGVLGTLVIDGVIWAHLRDG